MANSIDLRMTTQGTQEAIAAFDALPKKMKELMLATSDVGNKYENMKKKTEEAAQEQEKGFGQKAVQKFVAYAAGMLTIGTAIAAVKKGLALYNEELERASQLQAGQYGSQASFATIAKDQADFKRMQAESDKTRLETGASQKVADDLQFNLESLGLADDRATFAQLLLSGQDPKMFANAVASLQENLGVEETGSARELINKLFVAAESAKVTPDQVAQGLLRPGPNLKAIEASDEEAMAALVAISRQTQSMEEASTNLNALATTMDKAGVAGEGLLGKLQLLEERVDAGENIRDILGDRDEAIAGFRMLRGRGADLQAATERFHDAAARTGSVGDRANMVARRAENQFFETIQTNRSNAADEIASRDSAWKAEQDRRQQGMAEQSAENLLAGRSAFEVGAGRALGRTAGFFGFGASDVRAATEVGAEFAAGRGSQVKADAPIYLASSSIRELGDAVVEASRRDQKPATPIED